MDKNNKNIEKIESNLTKIGENKEDIASNLSEITYIKNNFKLYLKNVFSILYYDIKQKSI